jgi:GT2 family glycosyltransferase
MNTVKAMVELVAVLNSYNRIALLKKGLPSLLEALSSAPCEAAVVAFDAGSTDGSREWLTGLAAESDIPVHLVLPEPGAGTSISHGQNAVFEFARVRYPGLKWLFFFDSDNWLESPRPLGVALQLLQNEPQLAAAGFTVRRYNGAPVGYGCPFPTVTEFVLGPHLAGRLLLDRPRPHDVRWIGGHSWWRCDAVYQSPLLVRRDAWEQTGGLDPVTFPFFDGEVEWAWRLHDLGWQQAVIQSHDVVHDNQGQPSAWSAQRALEMHRARLALLRRHRGSVVELAKPLLLLRHALEVTGILLLSLWLPRPRLMLQKRTTLLRKVFLDYAS